MKNSQEIDCMMTGTCSLVSRYTTLKDNKSKQLARQSINETEYEIRELMEYHKYQIDNLNTMLNRLKAAKMCIIKKEGHP